jgi:hypothetical protein
VGQNCLFDRVVNWATRGVFVTVRVSCCLDFPLQGCKLVQISMTLLEMSDGFIAVFKCGNSGSLCIMNFEYDVYYFVVMAW